MKRIQKNTCWWFKKGQKKGRCLGKQDHHLLSSLTAIFHFSFPRLPTKSEGCTACVCLPHNVFVFVFFPCLFLLLEGSCIFHGYTPLLEGNYIWKMNKQKGFDYPTPKQSSKTFYLQTTCLQGCVQGVNQCLTLRPCHLIKRHIVFVL